MSIAQLNDARYPGFPGRPVHDITATGGYPAVDLGGATAAVEPIRRPS